jgi:cell division protein FtsA
MWWFKKGISSDGRYYCAIDVGTTKVCTLIGSLEEGDYFRILGVGLVRSQGMRKGVVIDLKEVGETVRESLREAEKCSGLSLPSAYIGITGSHISCFNTSSALAITEDNNRVRGKDMKRLLERARQIQVSSDRELLHAIPRIYQADREPKANPSGLSAFQLYADVHVVTAATNAVKNLCKSVRKAGLVVEDVILEPLASGEAVLRPAEKDVGVVVVDIGGGTTDIAVFKDGGVWHTAAIPVAGYQLTRDLSIGLGIPYEMAEELKVAYGTVSYAQSPTPPEFPLEREGRIITYSDLVDIITHRVEEILQLVLVELSEENISSLAPAGIVFTGGTSKLPGITTLAREIFHLPCRIGVPRNICGLVDHLHDPAFATTVGLLYWAIRYSHRELRKHHRPSPLARLWLKIRHGLWRW